VIAMFLTPTDVHTMLGRGTTVLVTDIATGQRVARQWFMLRSHIWGSIELTVSDFYGCEPEVVDLHEDNDGEFIMVKGEVVAKYEHI